MPDKKLTDNEIVKEVQEIKDSIKRHENLTNEIGQDLLQIDSECTGGKRVWLETKFFQKVFKHFCHSNFLVKTLQYALDLINRLQAQNKDLAETVHNLTIEKDALFDKAEELKAEIERLKTNLNVELENFATEYDNKIKVEAYKECIEKVRKLAVGMHPCSDELRVFDNDLDNLLKELMGEDNVE